MKTLILILLPSLALANYMSPSDIRACQAGQPSVVHLSGEKCGSDCVQVPQGFDCTIFDLIDGSLVENADKKFAKEHSEKLAKEAEAAKEEKCKAHTFKGTTIAQLRAELNEWKECK
jgi:hypothetical protein